MKHIKIKGARQHNLRNINLEIPKDAIVVFTGVSGSGKSSLAFDTIYAEGQRRYVESLSSYARQFLGIMNKPDVDSIDGLSPSISIDQKVRSHNPRSTVGTVTEIYDYLRLLYARIGHPHCPKCGREISRQSPQEIVDQILAFFGERIGKKGNTRIRVLLLAPVVRGRKGEFTGLFDNLRAKGYQYVRVDGRLFHLDEDLVLIKTNAHTIDVVVDRISADTKLMRSPSARATLRSRLTESVEQALDLANGQLVVGEVKDSGFAFPDKPKKIHDHLYSEHHACPNCNISLGDIEPRSFSFNSPHGACPDCSGIGSKRTVDPTTVLDAKRSVEDGGIIPFARMFFHDTWYARVVRAALVANNVNTTVPIGTLKEQEIAIILDGTGDRVYEVEGTNRSGRQTTIYEPFHGITQELTRRFSDTESEYVRGEIGKYMKDEICPTCNGKRLKPESLTVTVDNQSIADVVEYSIDHTLTWVHALSNGSQITSTVEQTIARPILKEIVTRLTFLTSVGLNYLTLGRRAQTLSGGEAQRIRLASQIGSGLSGVLYVLDEPSIGLHQRDNKKLIQTLVRLKELGNTVLVVEHDRETMESADHIVDFGLRAGKHGGKIITQGTVSKIAKHPRSLTAQYLSEKRRITRTTNGTTQNGENGSIDIIKASQHNLKDITASFPLGKLICVTGVSGSGKSTLVVDTLYKGVHNHFLGRTHGTSGAHEAIKGLEHIDKIILIDQTPIGRTPRSNPATYTGMFTHIRDIYAQLPESRVRGYKPGRFSFNVKGGRCEACEGEGQKKIEMQFLSDVYVTCEVCNGARYNRETLEVLYHGKSIADVLNMTIEEATEFFVHHPSLANKLKTIHDVGLDYIHLGQPAPTLSGGEAQRVKLATELSKRATGKTLYILDEPTTGLHFADLEKLLYVLSTLVEKGNTVVVIEHNLDIIKNADWIIDLGPEGGDSGGEIVVSGTPQTVARTKASHTGAFLKDILTTTS